MAAHSILASGPREVEDTPLSLPVSRRCADCLAEFSYFVEVTTANIMFDDDSHRRINLPSVIEIPVETCPLIEQVVTHPLHDAKGHSGQQLSSAISVLKGVLIKNIRKTFAESIPSLQKPFSRNYVTRFVFLSRKLNLAWMSKTTQSSKS